MQSDDTSVAQYIQGLPDDRRETVTAVRDVILSNLPDGFEEMMQYGMISYAIPLSRHSDTYNGQPLSYIALASQKNYISLYLMGIYSNPEQAEWFSEQWKAAGKKLNMGKSCVRFRGIDDIPLDVVGQAVAMTSVDDFIETYEKSRRKT